MDYRVYSELSETAAGSYIGALRLRAGYVEGWGGDDTLITDRFLLGGSQLRGFDSGGVGPRSALTGDALGANAYGILTTEVRITSNTLAELGMTPVLFIDTALIGSSDAGGIGVLDETSLRMSAGLSLLWDSPIGPIKFDFADVFVKENHDRDDDFRFTIGVLF